MTNNSDQKSDETALENLQDLSQLPSIDPQSVANALKHGFFKLISKQIYFKISSEFSKYPNILVSVNPYQRLPIYGENVINQIFRDGKQNKSLKPHPYSVGQTLYSEMLSSKQTQSALILGNSGSGKTELTKLILRYLAMTAPSTTMESSIIEQQLIASGPILEAFGNAKTVLNNNSSRFDTYRKVLYTKKGAICGQFLETIFLEKSRVVFQNQNERNFHIFYFLHSGLLENKRKELFLSKPESYHYTNQGKCCTVRGVMDRARFEELEECLKLLRMETQMDQIFEIISGILNLGNVTFNKMNNFGVVNKSDLFLNNVSNLWGIKVNDLIERLETKSLIVIENVSFSDVISNRDNITISVYSQLFKWICQRINGELYSIIDENERNNLVSINLLDSCGFENCSNNSLEQFCINYIAQKLQSIYNSQVIGNKVSNFSDHLDIIENDKQGIFVLLNNVSNTPKPNIQQFMKQLFEVNENSKIISSNSKNSNAFIIKHFTGSVCYNTTDFIYKNTLKIHRDTVKLLQSSNNQIIKQLSKIGVNKISSFKKDNKTITNVFYENMNKLMDEISKSKCHFVICINPNGIKSNSLWNESMVINELKKYDVFNTLKSNVMSVYDESYYIVSHWLRINNQNNSFGWLNELIWVILRYYVNNIKLLRSQYNCVVNMKH